MLRILLCACLLAPLLAGCSGSPLRQEVIAQANPDGQIAFDVVKVDDAVVGTLLAQGQPGFPERFKKYTPAPELKIGVGDVVSVVIFESAANGLFGESLTEVSLPPGAVAKRLLSGAAPPLGSAAGALLELGPALELSARLSGEFERRLGPLTPESAFAAPDSGLRAGILGQQGAADAGQLSAGAAALLAPGTAGGALAVGAGAAAALAPLLGGGGLGAQSLASAAAQQGLSAASLPGAAAALGDRRLEALLEAAVQSGRPGTRIPDQQVGSEGTISIPYAGRIMAAGRTPDEVQRAIEARLAGKALDPQVVVAIRRNLANSVTIEAEGAGGTRVPLPPGGMRLLQLISAAGGGGVPVHEIFLRLSRGGVTATVPLSRLVSNPEENIFAEPGDVVTLVRRPQTFTVFGATGKNTAITFNSETLSLSEALAKAGGLRDDRADPSAVFLFRYEPANTVRALGQPIATNAPANVSPVAYRLDMSDAKSYLLAKRFPVRDKDVIFVADAEIRDVSKVFTALSNIVGPVETILITCANSKC
jgi:polysaccharide biosynthesis/export protein